MANIIDYMTWRGDLSFSKVDCTPVDNLIFSDFIYCPFDGLIPSLDNHQLVTVKSAINNLFALKDEKKFSLGILIGKAPIETISAMKNTIRFGNVKVGHFVNKFNIKKTEQFAACTFVLNNKYIFVTFRGTDDSLIGWQENINLMNHFPVQAQIDACNYLEKVAKIYPEHHIYIGGHSKGGILAEYATTYCHKSVQDRIVRTFSNDGPGIIPKLWDMSRYNKIKHKIIKILPKDSVVGMIFETVCDTMIVKTSSTGLTAHMSLKWQVEGNRFCCVHHVSNKYQSLSQELNSLIYSLSEEDRYQLNSDLYKFLEKLKVSTLADVVKEKKITTIRAFLSMEVKNKKLFFKLLKIFIKYRALQ